MKNNGRAEGFKNHGHQNIVEIFEELEEEFYVEDLKIEKRKKENRATKRIMKGNTK